MNNIIAAQLFIKRLKSLLANHKERISFDPRNQKTQLFLMQEGMNTDGDSGVIISFHEEGEYD